MGDKTGIEWTDATWNPLRGCARISEGCRHCYAEAVARIADRCRHPDVDLFAANIRLQERSGGNLTGLLKTLARTVRERQKMRMKVKAASAEGNASAIILTAAPFCVFIFLWVASPHFYGDVINERPIQIGLGLLLGWMGVGNIIMRKMIDMRI